MEKLVTIKNKADLDNALSKLEPKEQNIYSVKQVTKVYLKQIRQAIKKGYSFKEIAEVFKNHQCKITAKELETAYNHLNNTSKTSIKKNPHSPKIEE